MSEENTTGSELVSEPTDIDLSAQDQGGEESSFFEDDNDLNLLGDQDAALNNESGDDPEMQATEEGTEDATPSTVTIDGQEYEVSALKEALTAQQNRDEWSRINTQRAQEVAEERKALLAEREQYQQFLEKIQQKNDPQSQMTDEERQTAEWLEKKGYIRKEDVEKFLEERFAPLQQTTEQLRQSQGSKVIEDELSALIDSGKIKEEEKADLMQFAVDNQVEHLPFEDVWILMNKDNIEKVAQEEAKEQAQKDLERKANAARIMPTRGTSPSTNTIKYNPEKHRGLSVSDLLEKLY